MNEKLHRCVNAKNNKWNEIIRSELKTEKGLSIMFTWASIIRVLATSKHETDLSLIREKVNNEQTKWSCQRCSYSTGQTPTQGSLPWRQATILFLAPLNLLDSLNKNKWHKERTNGQTNFKEFPKWILNYGKRNFSWNRGKISSIKTD